RRSGRARDARASHIRGAARWRAPGRGAATAPDCVKMWACESRVLRIYRPGLLLFHHALQRMLVFARKVHNLGHFSLGRVVGVDPAFTDPMMVHMEHTLGRGLVIL